MYFEHEIVHFDDISEQVQEEQDVADASHSTLLVNLYDLGQDEQALCVLRVTSASSATSPTNSP